MTKHVDCCSNWVEFETAIVYSKAFIKLRGQSITVLLHLIEKRQDARMDGRNDDELEFTYSEALDFGITNKKFRYAINRLIEVGFIDIKKHGGTKGQNKTLYSLSDRWKNYGTKDFVKFEKTKKLTGFCDKNYRAKFKEQDVQKKS